MSLGGGKNNHLSEIPSNTHLDDPWVQCQFAGEAAILSEVAMHSLKHEFHLRRLQRPQHSRHGIAEHRAVNEAEWPGPTHMDWQPSLSKPGVFISILHY